MYKKRIAFVFLASVGVLAFTGAAAGGCQGKNDQKSNPARLNTGTLPSGPNIYVTSKKHEAATGTLAEDWYMCVQEKQSAKNPRPQEVCDPVSKTTYNKNTVGKIYVP